MEPYEFVAIGDTVIDAFIRLKEASVGKDAMGSPELRMPFATKVPYEEAFVLDAVGNAPNGATAAARLGLKTAIITSVGNDDYGRRCLAAFQKNGISTEFVGVHNGINTNYHYVLWYGDERTILIRHEEFPYVLPVMATPKWIYWSSLRQGSESFHDDCAAYLAAHPEAKFAFQPGVFEIRMGTERLAGMYQRAEVVMCNKEEAETILKMPVGTEPKALLAGMRALGPRIAVVTDGKNGAYAGDETGSWFMPTYPDPAPPYERTGAGDAFSATFAAAIALGNDIPTALRWAPINSMSVVQKVGAQEGLLDRASLEALLAAAPAGYVATPLS